LALQMASGLLTRLRRWLLNRLRKAFWLGFWDGTLLGFAEGWLRLRWWSLVMFGDVF
jgi:hypothetical protein